MAVHFDRERMEAVLDSHGAWWRGELNRPLVSVSLWGSHPVERKAEAPSLDQASCADFQWSPEEVVEKLDEDLSGIEYLGDGFPRVDFAAFGPGVLAAFCGARLDNRSGRVWFYPKEPDSELSNIHAVYDPENPWVRRIKAIYRAGLERWEGRVLMGMPDLGGVLDVAATLRGTENLLMDLYDEPEEVERLIGEIERAWYEAFWDLAETLKPQGGYTSWSGLCSREPSYIVQCDFCYMIGNPMFRRFVLDTIRRDTEKLDHVIYHLDGRGELPHLNDLLSLPKLKAVQWVPGDGNPCGAHWMEVYRAIEAAGKRSWIIGGPKDYLDVLGEVHGTPYYSAGFSAGDREEALRILAAR